MLRYFGNALGDPEDRATGSAAALLRAAGRALRKHPVAAGVVLVLLTLGGTVGGAELYALHQRGAARTALQEGRAADARKDLAFCLWLWPRSVPTRLLAARAARLTGDLGEAETQLNQCLKLQKADEDIQLEFLLLRVQRGDVDEVAEQLGLYLETKHADTPVILETLARAYMHSFRYGPALATLDRWIEEDPRSAKAHFWRGWVVERLNHREDALDDYRRAVELDPGLVDARLRVAEMCLDQTRVEEAAPHLEALKKLAPDRPEVLSALGRWRFIRGELDEARPLLEAAVKKLPNDPTLLINLARLEQGQEPPRPAEAEKWLRHLLELDPYDLEALHVLAECQRTLGRPDEAAETQKRYDASRALLTQADNLLKGEMEHPSVGPKVPHEIGTLLLRIGQEGVALDWLYRALERDPHYRPAHEALAEYYEKKGDREKAATHRRQLAAAAGGP
jgi:tetratricopeptide (TPR) repeat protein